MGVVLGVVFVMVSGSIVGGVVIGSFGVGIESIGKVVGGVYGGYVDKIGNNFFIFFF